MNISRACTLVNFIDDYHPGAEQEELYKALKAANAVISDLNQSKSISSSDFNASVQLILANLCHIEESKILELQRLLEIAPSHILLNDTKSPSFFELLGWISADGIDKTLKDFKQILSAEEITHDLTFSVMGAGNKLALALAAWQFLDEGSQRDLCDIQQLLTAPAAFTFFKSTRLKVYALVSEIFRELDASQPSHLMHEMLTCSSIALLQKIKTEQLKEDVNRELDNWEFCNLEEFPEEKADEFFSINAGDEHDKRESAACMTSIHPLESKENSIPLKLSDAILVEYGAGMIERATDSLVEAFACVKKQEIFFDLLKKSSDVDFAFIRNAGKEALPNWMRAIAADYIKSSKNYAQEPEFFKYAENTLVLYCSQQPAISLKEKKDKIVAAFQSVILFFSDINASLLEISKNCGENLEFDLEEYSLLYLMNIKMKERGLQMIVPEHKNLAEVRTNISKVVNEILRADMGLDPSQEAFSSNQLNVLFFILSQHVSKVIERLLSFEGLHALLKYFFKEYSSPQSATKGAYPENPFTQLFNDFFAECQKLEKGCQFSPLISKAGEIGDKFDKMLDGYFETNLIGNSFILPLFFFDHQLFAEKHSGNGCLNNREGLNRFFHQETILKMFLGYLKKGIVG